MSIAKELRKIANIARRKSERIFYNSNDFDGYGDLGGFCARGSAILFNELQKRGYKPTLIEAYCHFYVECSGYVLDITATQFGHSKVIVRKKLTKNMLEQEYWFPVYRKFKTITEARNTQIKNDWPKEQIINWEDIKEHYSGE